MRRSVIKERKKISEMYTFLGRKKNERKTMNREGSVGESDMRLLPLEPVVSFRLFT